MTIVAGSSKPLDISGLYFNKLSVSSGLYFNKLSVSSATPIVVDEKLVKAHVISAAECVVQTESEDTQILIFIPYYL